MQKALFLDRDGVVNINYGYVHARHNFVFMPGIFDLVRAARENDYRVIIVTNQGGIGLGYYTENDFKILSAWMTLEFEKRNGKIDAVYFAPSHPNGVVEGLIGDSDFRKPRPGMLLQAKSDFNLNMGECIMVGDKITDMQAAQNAGVDTRFLFSSKHDRTTFSCPDCCIVNSLDAISEMLKR